MLAKDAQIRTFMAAPWGASFVLCHVAAHLAARLPCLRLHDQSPAPDSRDHCSCLQEAEQPAAAFKTYLVSIYEAPAEMADTVGPLPDQPDQVTAGMASSLYDPDDVRFLAIAGNAHGTCICCLCACTGLLLCHVTWWLA